MKTGTHYCDDPNFNQDTTFEYIIMQFKKQILNIKQSYPGFYFILLNFTSIIVNSFFMKKRIYGVNNKILRKGALLNKVRIVISGNNNLVKIEAETRLNNCYIYIKGDNHKLIIGKRCWINNSELWFEDYNCTIYIGDKVSIYGAHIACTEPDGRITIGNMCMLSKDIDIRNGDSHSILDIKTGKRINFAKDIFLDEHIWIAKGATILKNSTIGKNSVIGTQSLVSGLQSPPNCIIAGIPAKIIKQDINWDGNRLYN